MQTRHKLMIMALVFSLILLALGQKCHALSDYAGQGKAPITWDELMQPRVDPSRYFATPGGGHGVHPAGGYDAPQAVARAKPDKPAAPEVKQDVKPPMPHIPLVPAPKPEVKPEPKPDCKPKPEPEVKPDEHKCWHFKFRPVKHDCTPKAKPEHKAKPDCKHERDKPACNADRQAPRSDSRRKAYHMGSAPSNPGKDSSCGKFGGLRGGHHGKGKGRR